jgi:hypothetical protein
MRWRLDVHPLHVEGEGGLDRADADRDGRLEVVRPQDLQRLEAGGARRDLVGVVDVLPHRLDRRVDLLLVFEVHDCYASTIPCSWSIE